MTILTGCGRHTLIHKICLWINCCLELLPYIFIGLSGHAKTTLRTSFMDCNNELLESFVTAQKERDLKAHCPGCDCLPFKVNSKTKDLTSLFIAKSWRAHAPSAPWFLCLCPPSSMRRNFLRFPFCYYIQTGLLINLS